MLIGQAAITIYDDIGYIFLRANCFFLQTISSLEFFFGGLLFSMYVENDKCEEGNKLLDVRQFILIISMSAAVLLPGIIIPVPRSHLCSKLDCEIRLFFLIFKCRIW